MILKYSNVNPSKLNQEIANAGIKVLAVFTNGTEYEGDIVEIVLDDNTSQSVLDQINSIVLSHDPTSLPKPLSEIEQLRLENAQANAELFEMMLMLTGGGTA